MTIENALAARVVRSLASLTPRVVDERGPASIIELGVSDVLRGIQQPMQLLVADEAELVHFMSESPEFLDELVSAALKASPFICIVLSKRGAQLGRLLAGTRFAGSQPLTTEAMLMGRGDPVANLKAFILSKLNPKHFTPYGLDKWAVGRMFYGRNDDLAALESSFSNAVVLGARRIGKTSLVQRFRARLAESRRPSLDGLFLRACSYVDLRSVAEDTPRAIFGRVLREFGLDPNRYKPYGRHRVFGSQDHFYDDVTALSAVISRCPGELVIVLDEVDGWLQREAPQGWPTLETFRALADQGKARIILVGYELLRLATHSDRFPFVGRVKTIILQPLDRDAVADLIIQPIEECGIRFESKRQLTDLVWRETGGMPHLVQDVCGQLFAHGLASRDRVVTMQTVTDAVQASEALRTWKDGVWNSDFPLAEAVSGSTMSTGRGRADATSPVSVRQIVERLKHRGLDHDQQLLELALGYLELRLILRRADDEGTHWFWFNLVLRDAMARRIESVGEENWWLSVLQRHVRGRWRERYDTLGTVS